MYFEADVPGADLALRRRSSSGDLHIVSDGRPMRTVPEQDEAFIPGTTVFAGPWLGHFGHMTAEGIHRLWATLLPQFRESNVVFVCGRSMPSIPSWAERVFAQLGISCDRILFNNRPTRYERLVVARQGRGLGGWFLDGYLDLFPILDTGIASQTPIYLSRSRQADAGSYMGERLIEQVLADAGFAIVHPECEPLETLLPRLMGAESIVVCEGSAAHNLELCGRVAGRIFLIGRRHGAKNFRGLLSAASAEWELFKPGTELFSLDRNRTNDGESLARACTFLDLPLLIARIAAFTGRPLRCPEPDIIRNAVALDLATYLMHPKAGANATDEQLGGALRRVRAFAGLQALLDVAPTGAAAVRS